MHRWTVAIGSRGFDLVNTSTGSREFHGHARFMAQAEADARNGGEIVVMGDDAAQLMPFLAVGDGTTPTVGRSCAPSTGRLGRARRVPHFAA
jgi:hypothetical protein